MTPNGPMYVVGRELSTWRDESADESAEEKPTLRSIVDQLLAAVAESEAGIQKARAEANAEIAQFHRTKSDVEAVLAAEREATASLRQQLAEAEQLRLSAEAAREEAVQKQRSITDHYESRFRRACNERDAARANVAACEEIIGQLKAKLASDGERHDAAIAQLRQQLDQLTSESSRWSSIVHAVERVLAPQAGHEGDYSSSVAEVSPPIDEPVPEDEADSQEQPNREPVSSTLPSSGAATAPESLPSSIDTYARQLLDTAEQMYEMDRQAGSPAVEILDRSVAHLRYARDLVIRRAAGTADGDAVFRGALSALFNERWEHEFGRTLGFAIYELYGDSNTEKVMGS